MWKVHLFLLVHDIYKLNLFSTCSLRQRRNEIRTWCGSKSQNLHLAKATTMLFSTNSITTVLDLKTTKRKYLEARIIVLDDNFNSFEHVANCPMKIIPGMSKEISWKLTSAIDREGSAKVWRGPIEQAELYHKQLSIEGLTMAPIVKT